jgi:hypothetical protein
MVHFLARRTNVTSERASVYIIFLTMFGKLWFIYTKFKSRRVKCECFTGPEIFLIFEKVLYRMRINYFTQNGPLKHNY